MTHTILKKDSQIKIKTRRQPYFFKKRQKSHILEVGFFINFSGAIEVFIYKFEFDLVFYNVSPMILKR